MAGPGARRQEEIVSVASAAYAADTTVNTRTAPVSGTTGAPLPLIQATMLTLWVSLSALAGGATTCTVALRATIGGQLETILSVTLAAVGAAHSSIDGLAIPPNATIDFRVTRDAGTATLAFSLSGA